MIALASGYKISSYADSLLRSRTSTDHEATNMIKTQFMSLWDGVLTNPNLQVMVMGATNRPQDVDQAIMRRLPCSFYIDLPVGELTLLLHYMAVLNGILL